jgi:hypothetical protein
MKGIYNLFGQPIAMLGRKPEDEAYNSLFRLVQNAEHWHNHKHESLEIQSLQMLMNYCSDRIDKLNDF